MSQAFMHMENDDWKKARRNAFVQDVLAAFTHRPADLLAFEEVRTKLQLSNVHYLGLQDVALDHIVGSVGRYHDFNRAFSPKRENLGERWRRVDRLVTAGSGMPPTATTACRWHANINYHRLRPTSGSIPPTSRWSRTPTSTQFCARPPTPPL